MKRALPFLPLLLAIVALWFSWRVPATGDFDFWALGEIPVLHEGRVKPLDTVARNTLLLLRGRQSLRLENGQTLSAIHWLADALFNPALADNTPVFAIQNPEALGLFGWQQNTRKAFSYNELGPFLEKIDTQARQADVVEPGQRTAFQSALVQLRNALVGYQQLKPTLEPELKFPPLAAAYRAGNAEKFNQLIATYGVRELVPAFSPTQSAVSPTQSGDKSPHSAQTVRRAVFEVYFNHIAPFYNSILLYAGVFLLVCGAWLGGGETLRRAAFWLLLLALVLHTFGLAARMFLQGRPPVTNLYSSAVFVGWGTVLIGLFLERIFRDGIGLACSAVVGFVTLVIAHNLAAGGDTLEPLRAVLASNLWLTTHVVTIMLGYSAMFLAGMLAATGVLRGIVDSGQRGAGETGSAGVSPASSGVLRLACGPSESGSKPTDTLARMIYGVLCFAALFSFVGTVLGGIWADQSWGRFWGWDPKENGALLVVLWCAIALHAWRGGLVRQRGLCVMALFGNIVTAFSWFGVNMLGVGLHSYGFMERGFLWLGAFMASQLVLMALGAWRMGDGRNGQNG